MYKTLNEVESVIALGKPISLVDIFLESYLQGLEYDKWVEGKDLEETITVIVGQDEDGEDIIEERLVNVYEPVDVSSSMAQWKIDNYAILRQAEYPPMTEFLDAQVKGDDVALQAYKDKCIAVKAKYPK